ncbi:MAG: ester cyclase [Pseudomonadota bacterium]
MKKFPKGFDERFVDFPGYILGITREIWEDRGVGPALERYYAKDILVRAATGMTTSNEGVTSATMQTLHEFPDRQLLGEDVVWNGSAERGLLSSHRIFSVATHTGDGQFGKASGAAIRNRVIAECWVKDNQVVEEWLVRDQAAIAACIGLSAQEMAAAQVTRDLESSGEVGFFTADMDVKGEYVPVIESDPATDAYASAWQSIWEEREPLGIRDLYAPGVVLHLPGGVTAHGHQDIDQFVVSYLAALPDSVFKIEQLMINRDEGKLPRLAMRFSLSGTHTGWGRFGRPGGAPVYVMGMTQAHWIDGKVSMEWLLIDEVSVWKQILAHDVKKSAT